MTAPNPADSPEHFPFMKLPPEIRLTIYELALQNTIAAGMSNPLKRPLRGPYIGALALIHASTSIRKESRNAMHAVAHRQWEDLCARSKSLFKDWRSGTNGGSGYFETTEQSCRVKNVCTALEEPRPTK